MLCIVRAMRVAPGRGTEKMERKTSMTAFWKWWPSTTLTWPSCTPAAAEPVCANAVRRWSGPKRPFPCRWMESLAYFAPAPFEYQWTRDAPKWPKCWRATKTLHVRTPTVFFKKNHQCFLHVRISIPFSCCQRWGDRKLGGQEDPK